jgi:hypothetical protein
LRVKYSMSDTAQPTARARPSAALDDLAAPALRLLRHGRA